MLKIPISLGAALALGSVLVVAQQQAPSATTSYDDFMRLDAKLRRERFSQLGPENKALLVQAHARRWLAENRARLDSSEVAVFQAAIAFVTPEIYKQPMDPAVMKKEQEVKASLRCRVAPADVATAFDVLGRSPLSPDRARWSYLSRAKCWIGWFAESIVDYLPALR